MQNNFSVPRVLILVLGLMAPAAASAQQGVPAQAQRFGVGVSGGVTLDPELLDVGAHATFGPIFTPALRFRPGIELAFGEVTTMLAVNLDFLYELRGVGADGRWVPYLGAGPNVGFSHRSFESDDPDDGNRFDFSDTDPNGGFNFIAGARHSNGLFIEMKATAYGVSAIRLLAGFNF